MLHSANRLANALTDTLQAQQDRARALLQILDAEHDALANGDLAAMDSTAASKIAALAELEQLKASEVGLLADLPFANSDTPLEQALLWCDDSGAVRKVFDDLRQCMMACERRNHRNGILVQQRLNFVRRAVDILHAAHADTMTYGPDGMSRSGNASRLLAEG